jgi:hypothetical protein
VKGHVTGGRRGRQRDALEGPLRWDGWRSATRVGDEGWRERSEARKAGHQLLVLQQLRAQQEHQARMAHQAAQQAQPGQQSQQQGQPPAQQPTPHQPPQQHPSAAAHLAALTPQQHGPPRGPGARGGRGAAWPRQPVARWLEGALAVADRARAPERAPFGCRPCCCVERPVLRGPLPIQGRLGLRAAVCGPTEVGVACGRGAAPREADTGALARE